MMMEFRVDEDVFRALKARSKHPNERLNQVLRRVLIQKGRRTDGNVTSKGGGSHARRPLRTSQYSR